uniref:Cytochrome c domain-containing protein n=1 Tax=Anabas testudineus TaxID=64144 RepID=A0A3Q1IH09_ANATE
IAMSVYLLLKLLSCAACHSNRDAEGEKAVIDAGERPFEVEMFSTALIGSSSNNKSAETFP